MTIAYLWAVAVEAACKPSSWSKTVLISIDNFTFCITSPFFLDEQFLPCFQIFLSLSYFYNITSFQHLNDLSTLFCDNFLSAVA